MPPRTRCIFAVDSIRRRSRTSRSVPRVDRPVLCRRCAREKGGHAITAPPGYSTGQPAPSHRTYRIPSTPDPDWLLVRPTAPTAWPCPPPRRSSCPRPKSEEGDSKFMRGLYTATYTRLKPQGRTPRVFLEPCEKPTNGAGASGVHDVRIPLPTPLSAAHSPPRHRLSSSCS